MRTIIALTCCLLALQATAQDLKSGGPLKPEQANMDIRHYTIALTVDPDKKTIDGYAETDLLLLQPAKTILFDLVDPLRVSAVTVNGQVAAYTHTGNRVTITSTKGFAAGKQQVKIEYGGKPGVAKNPPWTGGFTWSKDSTGNPWIAITCQGEGAQIFFPCKDHPSDEPNEGADLLITVPEDLVVAGPGLLQEVNKKKGGLSTWHWKTNYTISNYCILFNVGRFKMVERMYTTVDGNKVPMQFYVLDYHAAKAPYQLELLEKSCRILEKYFGEYPWVKEKIGLCETPHLGMEHQTLNAYGNRFRYSKVNGQDFDWLMHHEFGHEWWANKVTNSDWAHMWIQEGICCFGDALYYREVGGEDAYLKHMRDNAANAENKKPIVQGDVKNSDEAYIGDIYGKGAFFIHSLRCVMGDSLLFAAVKQLATGKQYTYDNTVSTNDVEQLFSKMAGKNLAPYFNLFLRTVDPLKIKVTKAGTNQYKVQLQNLDMDLPLDITTNTGLARYTVTKDGITVQSSTEPVIDENTFYMKKVTRE